MPQYSAREGASHKSAPAKSEGKKIPVGLPSSSKESSTEKGLHDLQQQSTADCAQRDHVVSAVGWRTSPKKAGSKVPGLLRRFTVANSTLNQITKKNQTLGPWWILDPHSMFRQGWDFMMMLMIIYSVFMVPFRLAFSAMAEGAVLYIEMTIDVGFIVDICLNFVTAFEDPMTKEVIWDCGSIARHYLKGWFAIDFLSSTPFDDIASAVMGGESSEESLKSVKLLRSIRLIKLVRMLRLLKLDAIMDQLADALMINIKYFSLVSLVFMQFLSAHMLACIWFAISNPNGTEDPPTDTWVSVAGIADDGVGIQYMYSLYWAYATMTTVGYGDVSAVNDGERMLSIVLMICGVTVFGYSLLMVANMALEGDPRAVIQKRKMAKAHAFVADVRMPRDLAVELRSHFTTLFEFHEDVLEAEDVLSCLLPRIRAMCTLAVYEGVMWTSNVRFATNLDAGLRASFYKSLNPCLFYHADTIFHAGDIGDQLYFLVQGQVCLTYPRFKHHDDLDEEDVKKSVAGEVTRAEEVVKITIEQGSFGETSVMTRVLRPYTATGVSQRIEAAFISRDNLMTLCMYCPSLHSSLMKGVRSRMAELTGISSPSSRSPKSSSATSPSAAAAAAMEAGTPPRAAAVRTSSPIPSKFPEGPLSVAIHRADRETPAAAQQPTSNNGVSSETKEVPHKKDSASAAAGPSPSSKGQAASKVLGHVIDSMSLPSSKVHPHPLTVMTTKTDKDMEGAALVRVNSDNEIVQVRGSLSAIETHGGEERRKELERVRADLRRRLLIYPQLPVKLAWDAAVGLAIIYSVIIVPYRIGFQTTAEGGWLVIDRIADTFFFLDIIVSFRTTYRIAPAGDAKHDNYETSQWAVSKSYLTGWFMVDIVSTTPLDSIVQATNPNGGASQQASMRSFKVLRALRLARLIKLLRVLKLKRLIGEDAAKRIHIPLAIADFVKQLMLLAFLTHVYSCFWYYSASFSRAEWAMDAAESVCCGFPTHFLDSSDSASEIFGPHISDDFERMSAALNASTDNAMQPEDCNEFMRDNSRDGVMVTPETLCDGDISALEDDNWVSRYGRGEFQLSAHISDVSTQYIATLYWCYATFLSVGYGDVTATKGKHMEILISIMGMSFGTIVFAMFLSTVCLVVRAQMDAALYKDLFHQMQDYMNDCVISKPVRVKVQRMFQGAFKTDRSLNYDPQPMLKLLPASLRLKWVQCKYGQSVGKVAVVYHLEQRCCGFLALVAPLVMPVTMRARECLWEAGDFYPEMFFVLQGEFDIFNADGQYMRPSSDMAEVEMAEKEIGGDTNTVEGGGGDTTTTKKAIELKLPEDSMIFHGLLALPPNTKCTARYTVFSGTYVKMFSISVVAFRKILATCPKLSQVFKREYKPKESLERWFEVGEKDTRI